MSKSAHLSPTRRALREAGAKATQTHPNELAFTLRNGSLLKGRIRFEARWATVEAWPEEHLWVDSRKQLGWELLTAGVHLGRVRFAAGAAGALRLRADVPLAADGQPGPGIDHVCAGLKAGARFLETGDTAGVGADGAGKTAMSGEELRAALVDDRGDRDLSLRGDRLYAELDVPGRFVRARLQPRAGGVEAEAILSSAPTPLPEVCRSATAIYLLRISNALRMAAPCVYVGERKTDAGFAAPFAPADGAKGLDRALAALSAAARCSLMELRSLANEQVSRCYLRESTGGR